MSSPPKFDAEHDEPGDAHHGNPAGWCDAGKAWLASIDPELRAGVIAQLAPAVDTFHQHGEPTDGSR